MFDIRQAGRENSLQMNPAHSTTQERPPKQLARRIAIRAVVYAAMLYLAWCGALYFFQDRMLFHPEVTLPSQQAPAGAVVTRIDIPGGQIDSWLFPAAGASADKRAPLVVFCHGNAEAIDDQSSTVECYRQLGCAVLLPEYRGYRGCAGKPSEVGIVDDAVQFLQAALVRADIDSSRLVIHGRSLGGGVAAQVAARCRALPQSPNLRAVILESTFTSVAIMAHGYLAPEFLAKNPFRTDRVAPDLHCPILIFHGSQDTLIPVEHARRLKALSASARLVEYPAGHNDFPGPGRWDAYWQEIREFLKTAGVIP